MRIVIQRVSASKVSVGGSAVGEIGQGLCLFIGIAPGDGERDAEWAASKITGLRIFEDEHGKMNKSLLEMNGAALVISQFTLYADCAKGRRPSFTGAAPPGQANALYEYFAKCLRETGVAVKTGVFGADMKVDIVNEGPVTIILDTLDMPGR
ncbi:MAG: D-tyrosyl-tRNA(Tyr) deacylase [Synergistaceae bacterium]|nr:D-tyrosyl-tRNA(Tyr) deacylase [Synergistaceae bacterium]